MKLYQKLFSKILSALTFKTEIYLKENELISRYIFNKKYFKKKHGKATIFYSAFLPLAKDNKTSVFRISNLNEDEIWDIGKNHVGKYRKESLKARADIDLIKILDAGDKELSIIEEKSTHDLHADLVRWPSEKDKQLAIALDIANESNGKICPKS